MTAEDFAELLGARRLGAGRWLAKCPAHPDRRPSLSIAQGEKGVLLVCRSYGCTPRNIVTALGLAMRDLFMRAELSPAQRNAASAAKEKVREVRRAERRQRDRTWRLDRLMDALGGKLARNPDDREIGRLFHQTCDRLQDAWVASCPEDGPRRLPEPSAVPVWIHNELTQMSQDFQKEKAACEAA